MIQHIEGEFRYLSEKTTKILAERQQALIKLLSSQPIHQRSFTNQLDQINYMLDGRVYEEGLRVVLPMMLVSGGVQESIVRLERDKIRIALKIKEQINQIKTVLDGLFYVGGIKQLDQLEIKGMQAANQKSLDRYDDDLSRSLKSSDFMKVDDEAPKTIFQASASQLVQRQEKTRNPAFTNNYKEFAESLYPPLERAEFIDTKLSSSYPTQHFPDLYQEIDKDRKFRLFGTLEHTFPVQSVIRLRNGNLLSCSNQLTLWSHPQFKMVQQTAFNYGIHHVIEVLDGLLICQGADAISTYENKDGRWMPKGEFVTPGIGSYTQICLSDQYCTQDLLCILVDSQLMTYTLGSKNVYGLYERQLQRRPLEQLVAQNHPLVYQHKYECRCVSFEHDGVRMLTGDGGGRVYRWKVGNTFDVEECVQAHNSPVEGIIALHDGRVCSVAYDGIMKLWDAKLGQHAQGVVKHRSPISKVTRQHTVVDCFFTGDVRGKIQMWKVSAYIMPLYELDAHTDQITSIVLHKSQMITASVDKKVKIWNLSL